VSDKFFELECNSANVGCRGDARKRNRVANSQYGWQSDDTSPSDQEDMVGGFVAAGAMLVTGVSLLAIGYLVGGWGTGWRRPIVAGPFESGLRPTVHAVSRFHPRWYCVTLLFLAFDVEMLFMYPWAVVVADVGFKAVIEMFVFLGLLMAGVAYAWREGVFRWA